MDCLINKNDNVGEIEVKFYMAVKHIKEEYEKITNQYSEMLHEISDFEQCVADGMFPPERLEEIKKTIEPLKVNYERWSYIMFLLNKPVKKEKARKYVKRTIPQMEKKLNLNGSKNSVEKTVEENQSTLESFREKFNSETVEDL